MGTATNLASQPAIGAGTQTALNNITASSNSAAAMGNTAANSLSSIASGNFGQPALTGAANGDYLTSNPFAANGGLDTSYISGSGLNDTANGKYLTADSNPYIRGVAQQGADAAQSAVNSQFGAAGRSNGSGLYAQLFGEGISNATNSVYAQNYANERQLQQGAQNTLLSTEQGTREAALGRQSSAYEAERARQQAAAGGLINTQLTASSQLPGILASIANANNGALAAGQYQDQAPLAQQQQYISLLSQLAAPYGMSSGSGTSNSTQTTGGLGAAIGSIAQLGGAAGSLFGGGGLLSGLGGLGGLGAATSATLGGINSGMSLGSLGLSGWK